MKDLDPDALQASLERRAREKVATMNVSAQKVMIVQIPSEANAERLINERVNEANADGWQIVQMMDHNGFLVLLLEATFEPPKG